MPFASERQRRFMFARHPEIAKRWVAEGKGNVKRRPRAKTKRGRPRHA